MTKRLLECLTVEGVKIAGLGGMQQNGNFVLLIFFLSEKLQYHSYETALVSLTLLQFYFVTVNLWSIAVCIF